MKEIAPLLEKLAAKLGTTAEYLWAVLVRQATVEAWLYSVCAAVALSIACYVFGLSRSANGQREGFDAMSSKDLRRTIAVLFLIVGLALLSAGVGHFVNPEYYALSEILGALR
jgi:hypothetical protein